MAALPAVPAAAATGSISGLHLTGVSGSSFSVALKNMGKGWTYRLYASTNKANLYYANLSKATHSAWLTKPAMAVGGLRYTTAPYWWRIQARNGKSMRTSPTIYSIGLRPTAPTNLQAVAAPAQGLYLTWSSVPQTSFVIQQAIDSAFTQNVVTYSMRRSTHQFTPYGLTIGATYFFRIRAVNSSTSSGWSAPTSALAQSQAQPVRVMTFNLQTNTADGTKEGDGTVPSWSQRVVGGAKLVDEVTPDVIGVQESAGWARSQCSTTPRDPNQWVPLQADDLVGHLGGTYRVANTEVHPCQWNYFRTGVNIAYNTATVRPLGAGGWWNIGTSSYQRFATYQLFEVSATGARFLFVTAHELVGNGSSNDQAREDETNSMISHAQSYAGSNGNVPIVYAGDFNSNSLHPLDGPAVAMAAQHVADAFDVAQTLVNAKYDSANDDEHSPPAFGHNIDHLFAPPGVAVTKWQLVMDLSSGRLPSVIPSDHNPLVSDVVLPY